MSELPPTRTITAETATVFVTDADGRLVPADDELDEPGWIYEDKLTLDGQLLRIPLRKDLTCASTTSRENL